MAVNKVLYMGSALVDLTSDTVQPDQMVKGIVAHDKSGEQIVGTLAVQKYYVGQAEPSSSLGQDGDLYLRSLA